MKRLTITVPMVPPSVNHYKEPIARYSRKTGRTSYSFRLSDYTVRFLATFAAFARGKSVVPASLAAQRRVQYRLRMVVFLADDGRGDGDNFFKCVADSLVKCRVIHSDARVLDWHGYVRRDPLNPRTVVTVWADTGD